MFCKVNVIRCIVRPSTRTCFWQDIQWVCCLEFFMMKIAVPCFPIMSSFYTLPINDKICNFLCFASIYNQVEITDLKLMLKAHIEGCNYNLSSRLVILGIVCLFVGGDYRNALTCNIIFVCPRPLKVMQEASCFLGCPSTTSHFPVSKNHLRYELQADLILKYFFFFFHLFSTSHKKHITIYIQYLIKYNKTKQENNITIIKEF